MLYNYTHRIEYKVKLFMLQLEKMVMKPEDVAKTIINNVITDINLTVADIIIKRN